jgi:hypothetical protein
MDLIELRIMGLKLIIADILTGHFRLITLIPALRIPNLLASHISANEFIQRHQIIKSMQVIPASLGA